MFSKWAKEYTIQTQQKEYLFYFFWLVTMVVPAVDQMFQTIIFICLIHGSLSSGLFLCKPFLSSLVIVQISTSPLNRSSKHSLSNSLFPSFLLRFFLLYFGQQELETCLSTLFYLSKCLILLQDCCMVNQQNYSKPTISHPYHPFSICIGYHYQSL